MGQGDSHGGVQEIEELTKLCIQISRFYPFLFMGQGDLRQRSLKVHVVLKYARSKFTSYSTL